MDGNKGHASPVNTGGSRAKKASEPVEVISVEHLQRLVRLLDRSDVSEVEFHRVDEGTRLVLRKSRASESNAQMGGGALDSVVIQSSTEQLAASALQVAETRHTITAHLVGVFHIWAKPRGGALVAVGDHVKVGQAVATIESLNVINEVESLVAGRVVEILVQEGQPVEYGQRLMVLDSTAEKEGA